MVAVHERSRKMRMSRDRCCIICGRPIRRRAEGWYAGSREAGYRCTLCGQHPAQGGPDAAEAPLTPDRPLRTSLGVTSQAHGRPTGATLTTPRGSGALTERYRPRALEELWGQAGAVRVLRRFAASPFSTGFLFEGPTGTGKTSAALALAAELGCGVEVEPPELGGLTTIASGEQNADAVRDLCGRLRMIPMFGSGWKVAVANEADRMSRQAETIWLDRLEDLPARTVVVFTTNQPETLTRRLRDRCIRVAFEGSALLQRREAEDLAATLWRKEVGGQPGREVIERVVAEATEDGTISFRRVVQGLASELLGRE